MTQAFGSVRTAHNTAQGMRQLGAHLRVPFALALLALAIPVHIEGVSAATARVPHPTHFFWQATSPSLPGATAIDDMSTNNRPGALVFVTPNFDAGGQCGCINDQALVGLSYDGSQWEIVNENQAAMLSGQSFNVLVFSRASSSAFVHVAKASSITGNTTWLNSSLINGKPKVALQVSQVINRGSGTSVYNNHAVGVLYNGKRKRWGIFNEDGAMTIGASFNVMVGTAKGVGGTTMVQRATTKNTGLGGYGTLISNQKATGRPRAAIFETPNGNPGGGAITYDRAPTGVTYDYGTVNAWFVYDEDYSPLPVNAAFNLLVY